MINTMESRNHHVCQNNGSTSNPITASSLLQTPSGLLATTRKRYGPGAKFVIGFDVDPLFWQTWWFRLSIVLIIALAVVMFFQLRVLRLTKQMNMRFEERLPERTRIAQELHDTLLQGFLSASMQLHVVNDRLAADSPEKPLVNRVLELMGHVIEEGRNAVRGLRTSRLRSPGLEQAFSLIRQEFPAQAQTDRKSTRLNSSHGYIS